MAAGGEDRKQAGREAWAAGTGGGGGGVWPWCHSWRDAWRRIGLLQAAAAKLAAPTST